MKEYEAQKQYREHIQVRHRNHVAGSVVNTELMPCKRAVVTYGMVPLTSSEVIRQQPKFCCRAHSFKNTSKIIGGLKSTI